MSPRVRISPPWLRRYFYRALLIATGLITVATICLWSDVDHYAAARRCFSPSALPTQTVVGLDDVTEADAADSGPRRPARLPDILVASRRPTPGRTVFFHETSCAPDGVARLNARQACAIESAALSSPAWDVFVLFAAPSGVDNRTGAMPPLFAALLAYDNVHLRHVNLWTYAEETPLAEWMRGDALFRSRYLNSHASDLLRYLSLYKWGGTYLDLDVVLQRNLSTIPANYAGAESAEFVAAGVISMDHEGAGHRIAEACLREFQRSFDGDDWGNNGPGVITRVLHTVCGTSYPPLMTRSRCDGFEVFDIDAFYAVGWRDWRHFFDPEHANATLARTQNSYAVHVWNKHSHEERIVVGGIKPQAYGVLAARHCPRVYAAAGRYF